MQYRDRLFHIKAQYGTEKMKEKRGLTEYLQLLSLLVSLLYALTLVILTQLSKFMAISLGGLR